MISMLEITRTAVRALRRNNAVIRSHICKAVLATKFVCLLHANRNSHLLALPGMWGDFSLNGQRIHVEAAEVEEWWQP